MLISSQKLFSFSRYLSFCRDFSVIQKKQLDQKAKVNFKFHDVTTWLKNNCNIHIAQYCKAMKFGHLIEYNMRIFFFEKSFTKCAGETIPRHLSIKSKFSRSLDQCCKVLNTLLLCYANLRAIKIHADHLLLRNIKLFRKTKSVPELVSMPHFSVQFLKENVSLGMLQ